MVFNCSHFKNYQTRYTKWWRNVGEHYVSNLSTFRQHHPKNKPLKSNHLQSSTFSGCCENMSNVCKMILWEFFRRMILTNYICTGNNFRKRYFIISISRLESLLFRCDSHIIFIYLYFLYFDNIPVCSFVLSELSILCSFTLCIHNVTILYLCFCSLKVLHFQFHNFIVLQFRSFIVSQSTVSQFYILQLYEFVLE